MLFNTLKICLVLSVVITIIWGKPQNEFEYQDYEEEFPEETEPAFTEFPEETEPTFVKLGNKSYYFSEEELTWSQAVEECRNRKSVLAAIKSDSELAELSNLMVEKVYYTFQWWIDNDRNNDEENCSYIRRPFNEYVFDTKLCGTSAYYICQKN